MRLRNIKKILIIQLGDIGDVVWTTPTLWAVKGAYPDAPLSILVREGCGALLEGDPSLDKGFEVRGYKGGLLRKGREQIRFLKALRREGFSLVIDLRAGDRGAIIAYLTGAPIRVSLLYRGGVPFWRNRVFTHLIDPPATTERIRGAAEQSLRIVRGLGIAPRETIPKLQERQLMKTSIVICFYERLDFLKCCLDSLRNASNDFDEVIIADDGSGEDIVLQVEGLISQYDFSIIHAWHPREGPRRAATRNNGIRHAEGDYLIFLDADFVTLPGSIRSHLDAAKPGCFVAGRCKDTSEEQTRRMLVEGVSDKLLETIYKELSDEPIIKEHREFIRYGILRKLGLASARRQTFGGHFSAFRKDIETVNGYDENYVGWGGEDQDMAHRMVLAGFSGKSVIRSARMLHLWHLRELGDKHWKEGSNVNYYLRGNLPFWCENGLRKPGPS